MPLWVTVSPGHTLLYPCVVLYRTVAVAERQLHIHAHWCVRYSAISVWWNHASRSARALSSLCLESTTPAKNQLPQPQSVLSTGQPPAFSH